MSDVFAIDPCRRVLRHVGCLPAEQRARFAVGLASAQVAVVGTACTPPAATEPPALESFVGRRVTIRYERRRWPGGIEQASVRGVLVAVEPEGMRVALPKSGRNVVIPHMRIVSLATADEDAR
jgi:hypothetical protein